MNFYRRKKSELVYFELFNSVCMDRYDMQCLPNKQPASYK